MPFEFGAALLGHVRRDLAARLAAFPEVFDCADSRIALRGELDSYEARSAAMAWVARSLAGAGLLTKWRDELYEIALEPGGTPHFALERAAVRFFGFTASAVHLNGLVRGKRGTQMWIATRSRDKAIDPGMYDNLMGGGVARGTSVAQTLVKEAWEEAGIEAALASQSCAVGTFRVCREVPDGLHAEIIHIYDLAVPQDFEPRNQDGEVAAFRRLDMQALAAELEGEASYTVDAGLVALDCLYRLMPGLGSRLSSPD